MTDVCRHRAEQLFTRVQYSGGGLARRRPDRDAVGDHGARLSVAPQHSRLVRGSQVRALKARRRAPLVASVTAYDEYAIAAFEMVLLPVAQIADVTAERELLHIVSVRGESHTITYRLKDLETRLDPKRFVRLARGTLVNLDLIAKINVMPGGTYVAVLSNGKELPVRRLQSRILRDRFLKL